MGCGAVCVCVFFFENPTVYFGAVRFPMFTARSYGAVQFGEAVRSNNRTVRTSRAVKGLAR